MCCRSSHPTTQGVRVRFQWLRKLQLARNSLGLQIARDCLGGDKNGQKGPL